jgi:hypothetical protein
MVIDLREREEPLPTGPVTVEFYIRSREDQTSLQVISAGIPATEDWEEDYHRLEARWKNGFVELEDLLQQK